MNLNWSKASLRLECYPWPFQNWFQRYIQVYFQVQKSDYIGLAQVLRIGDHARARGIAVPCTKSCKARLFRMIIDYLVQQDFIPGIKAV